MEGNQTLGQRVTRKVTEKLVFLFSILINHLIKEGNQEQILRPKRVQRGLQDRSSFYFLLISHSIKEGNQIVRPKSNKEGYRTVVFFIFYFDQSFNQRRAIISKY
jgi:hypothetical protein